MAASLVLLTVGRNPLPCLIQAYRIAFYVFHLDGAYPDFLVVQTGKAEDSDRIRTALIKRLQKDRGDRVALSWKQVVIGDEADPSEIYQKVKAELSKVAADTVAHCAYTGGTSAMAVHTLEAAQDRFGTIHGSYLAATSHTVRSRSEVDYYASTPGRTDERTHWQLTLQELADLHGWSQQVAPTPPAGIVELAHDFLKLQTRCRREYIAFLKDWKKQFHAHEDDRDAILEELPAGRWPKVPFHWFPQRERNWHEMGLRLKSQFGGERVWKDSTQGLSIDTRFENRQFIAPLDRFLNNQALELLVYGALRRLLADPIPVVHSVEFKPAPGAKERFELDVVVVLGYQLVAFSCTTSPSYKTCKIKAFEVLHRAGQIGGSQASSVLVTKLNRGLAIGLFGDMTDGTAINGNALHILSEQSSIDDVALDHELKRLLQELGLPGILRRAT